MNYQFAKIFVVVTVSFVLLYYSVAWAVLRCSHDEDQSHQEAFLYNGDASSQELHYSSPKPVPLNLECVGLDYHTELMAESSSPSELHRLKRDIAPDANGVLTHRTVSEYGASDALLRAVFENLSSLSFPAGLPRYLSLSTLRI